ncbi:MAG TPA: hypothetical protein V6D29_13680 [Leptolyngbyaceae cyanobacterium]
MGKQKHRVISIKHDGLNAPAEHFFDEVKAKAGQPSLGIREPIPLIFPYLVQVLVAGKRIQIPVAVKLTATASPTTEEIDFWVSLGFDFPTNLQSHYSDWMKSCKVDFETALSKMVSEDCHFTEPIHIEIPELIS